MAHGLADADADGASVEEWSNYCVKQQTIEFLAFLGGCVAESKAWEHEIVVVLPCDRLFVREIVL
jgi:hypothetical protein